MCNKTINTSPSAIQFIPECHKSQEMCDKAVYACHFVVDSVPGQYKTQEMCDKFASEEAFMLKYCLDRYKTQEMCGKAVDACLPALNFDPDWFATDKILENMKMLYFLRMI